MQDLPLVAHRIAFSSFVSVTGVLNSLEEFIFGYVLVVGALSA